MSFTADFKLIFLDDPRFLRAVEKAKRKNLERQGKNVRTIMRRDMRRRKGPAPPGSPPNAHSGEIRDKTFYFWDQAEESVVVGPIWFAGSRATDILNRGGSYTLKRARTITKPGPVGARGGRKTAGGKIRLKQGTTIKVEARPFVQPAVEKSQAQYPDIWRDSIVP